VEWVHPFTRGSSTELAVLHMASASVQGPSHIGHGAQHPQDDGCARMTVPLL
jgi:hypothetical protein